MRAILVAMVAALTLATCSPDSGPSPRPGDEHAPAEDQAALEPDPTPASVISPSRVEIWLPKPGTSWQWQLEGLPVDLSVDVEMYDIDLFENDPSVVEALHSRGRRVVCYMSAGSWEDWRPDAGSFPDEVIGVALSAWEGEKWLDIRRLDVLGPIMEARMDLCQAKGFDAIEPDNVDGYLNNTGFPLSYEDQLNYNIWLADTAHARGLSIGLKNDNAQIPDLLKHLDWALNEECFEFAECEPLSLFIDAGKAVFNVEYGIDTDQFCIRVNALNFSSLKKNLNVDALRRSCLD
jgi:hypothetical protein